MEQVDIYSYHASAARTHSVVSKSNNSANNISHFEPLENGDLPSSKKVVPAKSKSAPKTPKIDTQATQRSSRKNTVQSDSKPKMPMIHLPTIQRPSRAEENKSQAPSTPHLYADQRVRQRSLSREVQAIPRPHKEVKKIVAFGRTTTVEDKSFHEPTSSRPSSNISSHEASKLRTDIEKLRGQIVDSEKLRKDMESLQKSMKSLAEKSNKMNQDRSEENEQLRDEVKSLRSEVKSLRSESEALSTQNGVLVKRVSELEAQAQAQKSKIPPPDENVPPVPIQSYVKQPIQTDRNMLYSRLAPTVNEQILRKKNEIQNRSTRGHQKDFYRPNYTRNESNITSNQKAFQVDKKALASNQIIDLNETYDQDDFRFGDD
jgi:DNA repair exonuclease SbcCD ATPase subunit